MNAIDLEIFFLNPRIIVLYQLKSDITLALFQNIQIWPFWCYSSLVTVECYEDYKFDIMWMK